MEELPKKFPTVLSNKFPKTEMSKECSTQFSKKFEELKIFHSPFFVKFSANSFENSVLQHSSGTATVISLKTPSESKFLKEFAMELRKIMPKELLMVLSNQFPKKNEGNFKGIFE